MEKTSTEKISRALVTHNITKWNLKCHSLLYWVLAPSAWSVWSLAQGKKGLVRYLIPAPLIWQLIWRLSISFPRILKKGSTLVCRTLCTVIRYLFEPSSVIMKWADSSWSHQLCGEGQSLAKQKYQWKTNWKSNASTVDSLCNKIPIIFLLTMKDMCKWFNVYEQKYLE